MLFFFIKGAHGNYTAVDDVNISITKDQALTKTRLHIASSKEFSYEACLRRLEAQRLPREIQNDCGLAGNPLGYDEEEHFILIHSLIDFTSECMVRAAGALLHFLDKYQIGGPHLDAYGSQASHSIVFAIRSFSPEDLVGTWDKYFKKL